MSGQTCQRLPRVLLTICIRHLDPVLLKRKAQKLREQTGDDRWKAPMEKVSKSILSVVGMSLLRPFELLFHESMCLILDIYRAILLGILYLFFGAFGLIFPTTYGFNLWQVGLTFLGLLVGMVVAVLSVPIWSRVRDKLAERRAKETGEIRGEPEDQLPAAIVGAFLITAGLFWFGWTSQESVHWILPIIGSGIFALG
jgi:hypothetical protein